MFPKVAFIINGKEETTHLKMQIWFGFYECHVVVVVVVVVQVVH
jgi:hypothetical protein